MRVYSTRRFHTVVVGDFRHRRDLLNGTKRFSENKACVPVRVENVTRRACYTRHGVCAEKSIQIASTTDFRERERL